MGEGGRGVWPLVRGRGHPCWVFVEIATIVPFCVFFTLFFTCHSLYCGDDTQGMTALAGVCEI